MVDETNIIYRLALSMGLQRTRSVYDPHNSWSAAARGEQQASPVFVVVWRN